MAPSRVTSLGASTNGHNGAHTNGNDIGSANGSNGTPSHAFDAASIEDDATMPIAIIGMAGRFPGEATDPEKLWNMIVNGRR